MLTHGTAVNVLNLLNVLGRGTLLAGLIRRGLLVTGQVCGRARRLVLRGPRIVFVLLVVLILPAGDVVIAGLSHEAISFPRRRGRAATRVRAQTVQIV